MEDYQNNLKSFEDYFHKSKEASIKAIEGQKAKREKFIAEYPIDRLASLTYDEYCLGTTGRNSDNFVVLKLDETLKCCA